MTYDVIAFYDSDARHPVDFGLAEGMTGLRRTWKTAVTSRPADRPVEPVMSVPSGYRTTEYRHTPAVYTGSLKC